MTSEYSPWESWIRLHMTYARTRVIVCLFFDAFIVLMMMPPKSKQNREEENEIECGSLWNVKMEKKSENVARFFGRLIKAVTFAGCVFHENTHDRKVCLFGGLHNAKRLRRGHSTVFSYIFYFQYFSSFLTMFDVRVRTAATLQARPLIGMGNYIKTTLI